MHEADRVRTLKTCLIGDLQVTYIWEHIPCAWKTLVGVREVALQQAVSPEAHVLVGMNTAPWTSSCCNSTAKPLQMCSSLVLTTCPHSKQQQSHDMNLPSGSRSGSQHSVMFVLCSISSAVPWPSLRVLGDSVSYKPRRKCYGLSKDGILVSSGFSWKLSPRGLCGKGKGLPAHVQLGFRKNLWHRVCSEELLICVTKAYVKTRFPSTPYRGISFKI